MVVVKKKSELLDAIKNKEAVIVVQGELAKDVKYLTVIKKSHHANNLSENMSRSGAVGVLTLSGLSTAVAITLIVTVGLVAIVAILKDYTIKVKQGDDELVLERA